MLFLVSVGKLDRLPILKTMTEPKERGPIPVQNKGRSPFHVSAGLPGMGCDITIVRAGPRALED